MEHEFPAIGRRTMLLNACRIAREDDRPRLVLPAFTEEAALRSPLGA